MNEENLSQLSNSQIQAILEAAIFAAGEPLNIAKLTQLFIDIEAVNASIIKQQLEVIADQCEHRGVELVEVANGYRFQAKSEWSSWLQRLWEKRPPRYSRALMETLALIVYKQPITRGEIEQVRGVAVSSTIIKTLMEREWVKITGYKEVPGRPALLGTTRSFLDYFSLKSIAQLPPLEDLLDLDTIEIEASKQLDLPMEPQVGVDVITSNDICETSEIEQKEVSGTANESTEILEQEIEPAFNESTEMLEQETEPTLEPEMLNDDGLFSEQVVDHDVTHHSSDAEAEEKKPVEELELATIEE